MVLALVEVTVGVTSTVAAIFVLEESSFLELPTSISLMLTLGLFFSLFEPNNLQFAEAFLTPLNHLD